MNYTTLQLEKLTCPSCMQKIIDTVNDLAGVEQTKILFDRSKARVFYNEAVISENNIIIEADFIKAAKSLKDSRQRADTAKWRNVK